MSRCRAVGPDTGRSLQPDRSGGAGRPGAGAGPPDAEPLRAGRGNPIGFAERDGHQYLDAGDGGGAGEPNPYPTSYTEASGDCGTTESCEPMDGGESASWLPEWDDALGMGIDYAGGVAKQFWDEARDAVQQSADDMAAVGGFMEEAGQGTDWELAGWAARRAGEAVDDWGAADMVRTVARWAPPVSAGYTFYTEYIDQYKDSMGYYLDPRANASYFVTSG